MAYTYGTTTYAKDSNGNYITLNGTYIYQIRLGYQINSQDIENNKSNISLQLEVRSVNSSYKTYGYNQTTTIDGTSLSAASFDFRSTNTWQIFGTRTFDVSHNADGTYSVEKSASFTTTATGTGRPHSGSASVTVALPTIPRASAISVTDANIGSSTNITINKASSSFTTTLEYSTNNSTWNTIVTKTSNQVYGWTVPTSFYSLIPNAKTMTCYFRATTYSGNTNVGVKTTTATFTATGNPVVNSSSATDVNSTTTALTGNSANMVKYASNVQVSVNVSGQNSATVSSVTINGSSVSLSGTNPKTGSITFNGATINSFEIKVTDSRGYQTTTTKTMTMVNYVPLTINQNIKRNQPTDEKVNVNLSGNYFNASFGSQSNTLTVQYRYKESSSSTWGNWTNLTTTASGNTYSGSTQLSNMDYTKQYNFEVRATDKIGTKPITGITVTKGEPVYWWNDENFILNVDTIVKSIVAKESRQTTPDFSHQYPNNKASKRFDICTDNMNSSANRPDGNGFLETFFWDNNGEYDTQLFIPNEATKNLQLRQKAGMSWSNNWKTIPVVDYFQMGDWTPNYMNCNYSHQYCTAKYLRIGKIVILVWHDRPTITNITGNGSAIITGLPYPPIWPQAGGGGLGTCQIVDTHTVPTLCVNYDYAGIELGNSTNDGASVVHWKTITNGWIDGTFVYICQ